MSFTLNRSDYRDKVLACWLGKNIGGTLGMPFEWKRQVNDVSFYTQDLNGEPAPNDDLDIQLLWLIALEQRGTQINARTMADYWCAHVTPHWAEYGVAKSNLRAGLLPPMSGTLNNAYRHSCGSYIRSEIWACIAPGLPEVAAAYAYEDSIIDHGSGEGTYAEVFFAALESAAFVHSDLRTLIEIGLSYIPADCAVTGAVRLVESSHDAGKSWRDTRDELLRQFRGSVPTWNQPASADDVAKGLHDGPFGYDVPGNVGLTVLALLAGGDDFGKIVCTAVNCGEDTDCTAATAASIYGIIHGTRAIPTKWIDPIGRSIKTIAINCGDLSASIPKTVDELTDRTVVIAEKILARESARKVRFADSPTDIASVTVDALNRPAGFRLLADGLNGPVFQFDFFTVTLDYGDTAVIRSGQPKAVRVRIRIRNLVQQNLSIRWYLPPGWSVGPSDTGSVFMTGWSPEAEFTTTLWAEKLVPGVNRAVLEITTPGLPTVMLVPVTLMNGDMMPTPI